MGRIKRAITGTRKKLAEIRRRLFRRRARVRFCKGRTKHWRLRAQHWHRVAEDKSNTKEARQRATALADRAMRKHAYWDELLDKAVLGKKDMERREADLQKKLHLLLNEKDRWIQNHLPKTGVVNPDKPWNPYGRSGAAWMVPWFDKVWALGVHFAIVSWFRSPEYSTWLCEQRCGQPTCAGTCAGANSNHSCPPSHKCSPYEGAADVSNYYAVRAALARVGAPLHNYLPYDPVHVSYSGH